MHLKNKIYIRMLLAFILTPYLAAMTYVLLGFAYSSAEDYYFLTQITVTYTYLTAIVVGLPGYFILKKLNCFNVYSFALLMGISAFVVSHFLTLGGYREAGNFVANIRALIGGVIGAGSFWFIVNKRQRTT